MMLGRILVSILIVLLATLLGWVIGTILFVCWSLHAACAWGWQQDDRWVWLG